VTPTELFVARHLLALAFLIADCDVAVLTRTPRDCPNR
jgi:hypothetical protein